MKILQAMNFGFLSYESLKPYLYNMLFVYLCNYHCKPYNDRDIVVVVVFFYVEILHCSTSLS